jgi:hypothetical protein
MGGASSLNGTDEKYIENFGWEAWRKETTQKTLVYEGQKYYSGR